MTIDQNKREGVVDQSPVFNTTHWTVVLEAGRAESEGQRKALAMLCQTYWYPIYAFVRRQGGNPDDAQDLTQGFFANLLSKDGLRQVDRDKGKFRTFLLSTLKNFLTDQHRRASAEKRGGQAVTFSIDDEEAEDRYSREPSSEESPDKLFDRSWVVTLLDRVMKILQDEQEGAGKGHVFEKLKPHVSKDSGGETYGKVASQLGISEEAVKKAVQRLRQRYGFLLRSEIACTVASADLIDEELSGLLKAWH